MQGEKYGGKGNEGVKQGWYNNVSKRKMFHVEHFIKRKSLFAVDCVYWLWGMANDQIEKYRFELEEVQSGSNTE